MNMKLFIWDPLRRRQWNSYLRKDSHILNTLQIPDIPTLVYKIHEKFDFLGKMTMPKSDTK